MTHLHSPTRISMTDRHVGARIREHRIVRGLTQQQMAQRIGVSYQQFNKYERGLNRISAGRLQQIAQTLGVTAGSLFTDLPAAPPDDHPDRSHERMCLELTRNFRSLSSDADRRALCTMARSLAHAAAIADGNAAQPDEKGDEE